MERETPRGRNSLQIIFCTYAFERGTFVEKYWCWGSFQMLSIDSPSYRPNFYITVHSHELLHRWFPHRQTLRMWRVLLELSGAVQKMPQVTTSLRERHKVTFWRSFFTPTYSTLFTTHFLPLFLWKGNPRKVYKRYKVITPESLQHVGQQKSKLIRKCTNLS